MKISARNQLVGSISAVTVGSVNTEVEISVGNTDKIVAIVTNASADSLGLKVGKSVHALIKASSILVMTETSGLALSARNILNGTVRKVNTGAVSAEVSIQLASGELIHATITNEAVSELSIKEGINACAVFKASSVIVGVAR